MLEVTLGPAAKTPTTRTMAMITPTTPKNADFQVASEFRRGRTSAILERESRHRRALVKGYVTGVHASARLQESLQPPPARGLTCSGARRFARRPPRESIRDRCAPPSKPRLGRRYSSLRWKIRVLTLHRPGLVGFPSSLRGAAPGRRSLEHRPPGPQRAIPGLGSTSPFPERVPAHHMLSSTP